MREVGTPSWRFSYDAGDQHLHAALHVRDAFGLVPGPVPAGIPPDVVPPPLRDVPTRRPWPADWPDAARAGVDCTAWFVDVLGLTVALRPSALDWDRWAAVFGPPDFGELADRPGLQRALVAAWPEGRSAAQRHQRPGPPEQPVPWTLLRDVVEDVAFDRGVDPGVLAGRLVVLDVEGPWSCDLAPGTVMCSRAALDDLTTTHALVRRALLTGLDKAC